MKTQFILTFSLFLLYTVSGIAQGNWTLLYENDKDGQTVRGELSALITAIQNGEEIRIYFNSKRPERPERYVEHTCAVKFTTIVNSPDGRFVTAQIEPIIGQTPNATSGEVTFKENMEWCMIASTNGKNDNMMRNVITGEVVSHRIVQRGTKWFVHR